jgi:hypothetical protein
MRFREVVLVAGLAGGAACALLDPARSVRADFPGVVPFDLSSFREIAVPPFRDEGAVEGLAPGKEAAASFAEELGRRQKIPVTVEADPGPTGIGFGRPGTLVLEGDVRLKTEVRKAISESARPVDGPFGSGSGLTERRSHVLELTLTCRDGASGEALYRKAYRETKSYEDTDSSAGSAFFELLGRARQKFLRTILGEGRNEERILLLR